MIGKIASVLDDEDDAEASPFGRCESGTRTGLCRRIDRFFCDLPMARLEYEEDNAREVIDRLSRRDHLIGPEPERTQKFNSGLQQAQE